MAPSSFWLVSTLGQGVWKLPEVTGTHTIGLNRDRLFNLVVTVTKQTSQCPFQLTKIQISDVMCDRIPKRGSSKQSNHTGMLWDPPASVNNSMTLVSLFFLSDVNNFPP